MAKKKVCDFCLDEFGGLFSKVEKLPDGHMMCKNCKSIIQSYNLPLKYDLFQCLVTAQQNMQDMIMDAYLESHDAADAMAKFYPLPAVLLHDMEHCINACKATITVDKTKIPMAQAVKSIALVQKSTINNIPDTLEKDHAEIVRGTLYETEAALYFLSDNFVNCHRLGYMQRNQNENDRIIVKTPTKTFTYKIEHADMFYMRERFFRKVNAAKHNKRQHLIYLTNEDKVTITPGVYDIPKALRPGIYKVRAINDAGLHIRDQFGRVKDYYENEESIDLSDGGVLECTGEYQLQWIGEKE